MQTTQEIVIKDEDEVETCSFKQPAIGVNLVKLVVVNFSCQLEVARHVLYVYAESDSE